MDALVKQLKDENRLLSGVLRSAHNAHRRKSYMIRGKYVCRVIDALCRIDISQLRSSEASHSVASSLTYSGMLTLLKEVAVLLKNTARDWERTLLRRGFFLSLVTIVLACLAKELSLIENLTTQVASRESTVVQEAKRMRPEAQEDDVIDRFWRSFPK